MKIIYFSTLLFTLLGCSTLPNTKKTETQFGKFTYYLSGKPQKPTLILESGLGDSMTSWKPILKQLEDTAFVFTYNRAGFKGSKSKNKTRNGAIVSKELRVLLEKLNIQPPYILVGHSLGGTYMEIFAKTFPSDVSGVILIDPNSSIYPSYCKKEKLEHCDPPTDMPIWASLIYPPAVKGEIQGFRSTNFQANQLDSFPEVPLAIISATFKHKKQSANEKKASELYTKMHHELAKLSSTSRVIECHTCGHHIHWDSPPTVIDAIKWVIEETNKTPTE